MLTSPLVLLAKKVGKPNASLPARLRSSGAEIQEPVPQFRSKFLELQMADVSMVVEMVRLKGGIGGI